LKAIKFSRHAKRRIKLYHISELVVRDLIEEHVYPVGHHEIVKLVSGLMLPLKVVFDVQEDSILVITAYPLKRRKP